jgi:hypothetical protein
MHRALAGTAVSWLHRSPWQPQLSRVTPRLPWSAGLEIMQGGCGAACGLAGWGQPSRKRPRHKKFYKRKKPVFMRARPLSPCHKVLRYWLPVFLCQGEAAPLVCRAWEKPAWAKFSGGGENFAYFVLLGQNITIITWKQKKDLVWRRKTFQESAFLKPLFCSCIRLPICYIFNT